MSLLNLILRINCSVSRDAVPLPIAIASILYALTRELIFLIAPFESLLGGCGYMVSLYSNFPCAFKHTTLHPVLKPGSMANMLFSPRGAPNNNCFKFFANTAMAASSALSLAELKISFDKEGNNKRL